MSILRPKSMIFNGAPSGVFSSLKIMQSYKCIYMVKYMHFVHSNAYMHLYAFMYALSCIYIYFMHLYAFHVSEKRIEMKMYVPPSFF